MTDAGRAHQRRLRFLVRRRRHPGPTSKTFCRASGGLRRLRDHGADRARTPPRPAASSGAPDFVTAQLERGNSPISTSRAVKIGWWRSPPPSRRSGGAGGAGRRSTSCSIPIRWRPRRSAAGADAISALRTRLFRGAALITPNLPEAAALLARRCNQARARSRIRPAAAGDGCPRADQGGHGRAPRSIDYLVPQLAPLRWRHRASPPKITHGTGCSLSSAIAAGPCKGEDMETAVRHAKAFVSAAIAAADRFAVGHGHGPIHHFQPVLLDALRSNDGTACFRDPVTKGPAFGRLSPAQAASMRMTHWQKIPAGVAVRHFAILIFCAAAALATMALIHRHEHVERRDSHRPPTADVKSAACWFRKICRHRPVQCSAAGGALVTPMLGR